MKKLFPTLFFLFITFLSNSQITKKKWLFGGNINFSSTKSSNNLGENTTTTIQASGNAGYFLIDKLVLGIRPNIFFSKFKTQSGDNWSNRSFVGPFLRYYFLPNVQRINLFAEGGYAFGTSKVSNQNAIHSNSFSFSAGPVFFLNTSVALELSIGCNFIKSKDDANSKLTTTQVGIGLQYHLERE